VSAIFDKGYDSFAINGRTLPKTHELHELTGNDSDRFDVHPGMDCLIVHRDDMPRATLWDMFMGYSC
jgi:mRNA-degrading endonuclease YafQ of YafQ-DinJ toxin-antitoxin module